MAKMFLSECSTNSTQDLIPHSNLFKIDRSLNIVMTLLQERIVSSLNLKSSTGELESYCLIWSLRPFINDEIMHQAWKLLP
ncbi:hypothetical protein CK203_037122 [Vitis vinifera]|uniref:Uncharacterized protein n=1 Tax=Vitis vinifera TaxID=29760 RepID=A0A438I5U9_VITVI|nr:hypothetical protein CK203_037122 [Vitis vinifera]